ncbi:MAG TPA: DNA polymerase I [Gaiellales bacterium]|nr:DNA polymerase I [Gaiellales bacterium]
MVAKPSELDLNDGPARASRLFLVDGNSLAYRAYYALPEELATTDGFPTNALLGFANMLMRLLTDYKPEGVIVAWDTRPVHRLERFPGYKASRKPTPSLLKQQQPFLRPLVEAFGYRNVELEGYEADDVIGTLSLRAEEQGIATCVISHDRDAFQLVSEHVSVLLSPRGVTDVHVYTPERVEARYGIPPRLVPDFIGLKGDTSDDIAGVPGIGDKTASELLVRFGSLEGIYANVDAVPGEKRRQTLIEHREEAERSKQLATIERDLPLDVDLAQALADPPDRATMGELFRRFEFRALLRRIDELEAAVPGAVVEREEHALGAERGDAAALATLLADGAPIGLAGDGAGTLGLARGGQALLIEESAATAELAAGASPLVAHSFKQFGGALAEAGVVPAFDTELAAYLIDPGRSEYDLDDLLAEQGLAVAGADGDGDAVLARRAAGSLLLYEPLSARIAERELGPLLEDIELPLVPVLCAMERAGVAIDSARMGEIAARVSEQVEALEEQAHELAGEPFALGSPKQLGEVLFERLGLPAGRRGKTGYSTDQAVLARIRDQHAIVAVVEEWRELSKLLSTYLLPLPGMLGEDGRLHTTFSQVTAATGRLSAQRPNLQNIPIRTPLGRELRATFVAAPGHRLLSVDYSQVELRILAHLSGEELLREAFGRGEDIHAVTAAEVLGKAREDLSKDERNRAKAVNFGIIYGISAHGLSEQLEISRDEAQAYIDTYRGRMPLVAEFIERAIVDARERGFAVTLLGRRRPIPELRAQSWNVRSFGERLAVNTVIQGSAADIIKLAMVRIHRRLAEEGRASRLVLQIHDELLLEVPDVETTSVRELVIEEMVGAYPLDPPLAVDSGVGDDWLAAKS